MEQFGIQCMTLKPIWIRRMEQFGIQSMTDLDYESGTFWDTAHEADPSWIRGMEPKSVAFTY